jgi:hypothetical protein
VTFHKSAAERIHYFGNLFHISRGPVDPGAKSVYVITFPDKLSVSMPQAKYEGIHLQVMTVTTVLYNILKQKHTEPNVIIRLRRSAG